MQLHAYRKPMTTEILKLDRLLLLLLSAWLGFEICSYNLASFPLSVAYLFLLAYLYEFPYCLSTLQCLPRPLCLLLIGWIVYVFLIAIIFLCNAQALCHCKYRFLLAPISTFPCPCPDQLVTLNPTHLPYRFPLPRHNDQIKIWVTLNESKI